ncbi:MAG: D-sedoheptulose 7-phosphate isomerase [Saprospiraceae bacterium]
MNIIIDSINSSIKVKEELLNNLYTQDKILEVASSIVSSLKLGGRIYFCGNGGSAADAQHLAAELSGRFYMDRQALAAEALHSNTSYLTAVANDYGYDVVYSRIIEGVGKKNDVLIGISTSGNSKNIVLALEAANKIGMQTIGLTGENGGNMKEISKIWIPAASNDTPRIQETHILIGHIICQLVEHGFFLN